MKVNRASVTGAGVWGSFGGRRTISFEFSLFLERVTEREFQRWGEGDGRYFKVRLQAVHLLFLHVVVCGKP